MTTILLPPSRGMASGGDGPPWSPDSGRFGDSLADLRAAIAGELAELGGGDERLLGLKGDRFEEAAAANASLLGAPTLPAWQRYTGVVYDALDPADMRGRSRLVVVSALLGLAHADDPVPAYRLAGNDRLPGVGRLRDAWPEALGGAVASLDAPVLDLTSDEYHRLLPPDADSVRVDVVRTDGRRAGHWGKVAKGLLVREVAAADDPLAAVDAFSYEDFRAVVT
ncbi:MAG: peroxide stress protein YaaA [Acidimicrobiia bacterium]|nr:peroxide stress protein YaaA [Acidimicrobiia bacterium]